MTTPPPKCMALVPNPSGSPWCPQPADPRSTAQQPRCAGHLADKPRNERNPR